jgi:hypothetical protein
MVDIVVTPSPAITVTVSPAVTPTSPPTSVSVLEGQPGPKGEKGDTGPSGITQSIAYTHTQNAVSSTWSITHNLGFYPNVALVDSADSLIEGTITYTSATVITVTFGVATSGKAYLS